MKEGPKSFFLTCLCPGINMVCTGSTADALTLLDALEAKLGEYPGQFTSLLLESGHVK